MRMFQESWRNRGIGADWWEETAQRWGWVGRARGWMGQGRERVARDSDAFFGARCENGRGVGEGVGPGCGLGCPGDIGSAMDLGIACGLSHIDAVRTCAHRAGALIPPYGDYQPCQDPE